MVVSEQFEFQKEKDKYQLNSLTKFLFNKYGFHAYFDREVPPNVIRCDGLWAEAEGTPGFIITKVQLVLKDCNGKEVFRTNYGKSEVKDYKEAYYESVREAFNDIIKLDVSQKEIEEIEYVKPSDTQNVSSQDKKAPVVETTIIVTNTEKKEPIKKAEPAIENTRKLNLPTNKYTNYSYLDKTYLLRKTSLGYTLYQELLNTDEDLLLIGKVAVKDSIISFKNEKNKTSEAYFDESNNLIIGVGKEEIKYKFEN